MGERISTEDHLAYLKGAIDGELDDAFSLSSYEVWEVNRSLRVARSRNAHYWDATGRLLRPLSSKLEFDAGKGLYVVEAHPLLVEGFDLSESRLVFSGVLRITELTSVPEPSDMPPDQFEAGAVAAMASRMERALAK